MEEKEKVIQTKDHDLEAKEKMIEDSQAEKAKLKQELVERDSIIERYCVKYEELIAVHEREKHEVLRTQEELVSALDHSKQQLLAAIENDHLSLKKLVAKEKGLLSKVVLEKVAWQGKARQEFEALKKQMTKTGEKSNYRTQKTVIHAALQQCLRRGETW